MAIDEEAAVKRIIRESEDSSSSLIERMQYELKNDMFDVKKLPMITVLTADQIKARQMLALEHRLFLTRFCRTKKSQKYVRTFDEFIKDLFQPYISFKGRGRDDIINFAAGREEKQPFLGGLLSRPRPQGMRPEDR